MAGEADQEDSELMKDVPYERTLKGIKTWKKCIIMLAGVFMNFVLALVLLIGIYSFVEVQTNTSEIGSVVKNNGAYNAGVQAGDTINKSQLMVKNISLRHFQIFNLSYLMKIYN